MNHQSQTLEDLLIGLSRQWPMLMAGMLVLTLGSLIICYALLKSNRHVWAHRFMSIPIYLTTIPGMFYLMILAYLLFFTGSNLLSVPAFYFFPPLWMAASLYLYRQFVNFEEVPGFTRLSGMALFAGVAFAAIFVLARLRVIALVWITPKWLIPLVILFYLAGRIAWKRMTARKAQV